MQEAGVSFYSYIILQHILRPREKTLFLLIFWFIIAAIVAARMAILVTWIRLILNRKTELQPLVNHLQIGYFTAIAVLEVVSAVFLLRKFSGAQQSNSQFAFKTSIFKQILRSIEIRLACLVIIGSPGPSLTVSRPQHRVPHSPLVRSTDLSKRWSKCSHVYSCKFKYDKF